MARRRPKSFQSWALRLEGLTITGLAIYYARIAVIDYVAEQQTERAQRALEKLQQQVNPSRSPTVASATYHQSNQLDAEGASATTRTQRQHDIAWNIYYQEPRGCDNWRSDQHMVECLEHNSRARREFEQKWTAEQLH